MSMNSARLRVNPCQYNGGPNRRWRKAGGVSRILLYTATRGRDAGVGSPFLPRILDAMPMTGNWKFVKNLYSSYVADKVRFAIREWSGAKLVHLNVVSFLVAVTLLTYLGPFGTWTLPPFSERLPFWLMTVGANWVVGYIAFYVIPPKLRDRRGGIWAGFVLAAAGAALPGTGTAWLAVALYLDYRPSSVSDLAALYGQVFVLHLIIGSLVFHLIDGALRLRDGEEELPPPEEKAEFAPPSATDATLLARLPARSRAELLHLRMQDHYVEVHTTAGSEMLLLRFRDALSEVEGVNGLQVHRSHWVARNAVAGVERRGGGRIALRLVNGSRVPVSRSFAPLLRSRGWI